MAKFDISSKGASDLRALAKNLNTVNREIEECGKKLQTSVMAVGDDLGGYEDQILTLVKRVTATQKKGMESVDGLCQKLNRMAKDIEALSVLGGE